MKSNYSEFFSNDLKELEDLRKTKHHLYHEILNDKFSIFFNKAIQNLNLLQQIMAVNPSTITKILSSILIILLHIPLQKLIKYVFKSYLRSLIVSIDVKYLSQILFCVQGYLRRAIELFNNYCEVHTPLKKNSGQHNLFEIKSELYLKMKNKDIKEATIEYFNVLFKSFENFTILKEQNAFTPHQFYNLFSFHNYIEIFPLIHKNIMKFLYLSIPVTHLNFLISPLFFRYASQMRSNQLKYLNLSKKV